VQNIRLYVTKKEKMAAQAALISLGEFEKLAKEVDTSTFICDLYLNAAGYFFISPIL